MEESVFAEWVAGLRAAIKEAKGERMMAEMWTPIEVAGDGWFFTDAQDGKYEADLYTDGRWHVGLFDDPTVSIDSDSLNDFISRLEALRNLAKEHFGEDWGKCPD